jgi:hypothetical protein
MLIQLSTHYFFKFFSHEKFALKNPIAGKSFFTSKTNKAILGHGLLGANGLFAALPFLCPDVQWYDRSNP